MNARPIKTLLLALLCLGGVAACGRTTAPAPPDDPPPSAVEEEERLPDAAPTPTEIATRIVDALPLDAQVGQLFFVRCPEHDAAALAAQYPIGGYLLFGRDFAGQTADSVQRTIASYQDAAATPLLIGVDEEGGTVVRVSAEPALRQTRFRAPQALYREGGLDLIERDTAEKDALLASLGINVDLAPVCDVSTDPADFIYARSLGQDAATTAQYVRTVVAQMAADGMGMVLKHFPGYGDNADTHTGIAIDERPLDVFRTSDLLPFAAGIEAGAQAILVSHNVVTCMDDALPASLSPAVHRLLRDDMGFDGVIVTDDLAMQAITDYTGGADAAVRAVQAGNDLLICSDFPAQYDAVRAAVRDGTISPDRIRAAAVRVIRWKLALGLFEDAA